MYIHTPLFWDCSCSDRNIHPHTQDHCPICGDIAVKRPFSRPDNVLFNAKFFNLDPALVQRVREDLQAQHPLLAKSAEGGFDSSDEVEVVLFEDLVLELEKLDVDWSQVPENKFFQILIGAMLLVHIDFDGLDEYVAAEIKKPNVIAF